MEGHPFCFCLNSFVTIHSNNLYHIYTYVKNLDKAKTGNVSGLLLYITTDEMMLPCKKYKIDGNIISLQTLNLDCDFDEIRVQLNKIVEEIFELSKE